MPDDRNVHQLRRDWRRPRVDALRVDAQNIREAVDHLADLVDLFVYEKNEDDLVTELRTMIGTLKTAASDRESEAETLAAIVQTREVS